MKPCTQSLDGSADNPFLSVSEGTGCRPPTNIAAGSRYLVSCIAVSQGGDLQPHHQLIVKPSKFDPDWFRMQIERFKRSGSMPLVGDEEFQRGGEVTGNVTESQRLATKAVMEALGNVPNLEVVLNTQEEGRQAAESGAGEMMANSRFNNELEEYKNNTHVGFLHLGSPSKRLKACGVNAKELL